VKERTAGMMFIVRRKIVSMSRLISTIIGLLEFTCTGSIDPAALYDRSRTYVFISLARQHCASITKLLLLGRNPISTVIMFSYLYFAVTMVKLTKTWAPMIYNYLTGPAVRQQGYNY